MDSIGEVDSANRVSPRHVSEEKKTDSGAETTIATPDPTVAKVAKKAVVNATVSMVGHSTPKNDENRKDSNANSPTNRLNDPQKSPNLTALLTSKRKPAATATIGNTQPQNGALSTSGRSPRAAALSTAGRSPRDTNSPRAAVSKKADPQQVSPNQLTNRKSSAIDVIGNLKAQIQGKQKLLESLQSSKKTTSTFSSEVREIEEAIDGLTVDFDQSREALRIIGEEIVRLREETLSFSKEAKICDEKYSGLQKNVLNAFSFVECIMDFKGKLKAKLQATSVENVQEVNKINRSKDNIHHYDGTDTLLRKFDHDTLVLIAREMGKKLRVIEGGRVEAENYAIDAKQSRSQYETLWKEHNEMQELHLEQAKLIQRLQGQNGEVSKFKDTLLLQEKVIAKMQAIVETRLMPPMTADLVEYDGSNAHERVAEEIYKLNLMIDGERQHQKDLEREYLETLGEKQGTKKHIWDLETGLGSQKAIEKEKHALLHRLKDSNEHVRRERDEVDLLETEINARDLRISALEEQMVMAARSTAKEISKLKTKLFDLEISMTEMGPFGSMTTKSGDIVDDNVIMKRYEEIKPVPRDFAAKVEATVVEDTPSGNATNAVQFLSNIRKLENEQPTLLSLVIDTTVESPKSTSRKSSSSKKHSVGSKSRKATHRGDKSPRKNDALDSKNSLASGEKSSRKRSPRSDSVSGSPQKPSKPKGAKPSKNAKAPKTPKTPKTPIASATENVDVDKEKSNHKSGDDSKVAKIKIGKGEKGDIEEAATGEEKIDEPVSARLTSTPRKFSIINSMMKISPRMSFSGPSVAPKDGKSKDEDDDDDL